MKHLKLWLHSKYVISIMLLFTYFVETLIVCIANGSKWSNYNVLWWLANVSFITLHHDHWSFLLFISDNSKTPPRVKTSSFTCLSFCLIFILLAPGSQERDEVSINGLRGCNHKSFVKRVLFYFIFKIFLFFFTEQNVEVGISDHPALYVSLCKKKEKNLKIK